MCVCERERERERKRERVDCKSLAGSPNFSYWGSKVSCNCKLRYLGMERSWQELDNLVRSASLLLGSTILPSAAAVRKEQEIQLSKSCADLCL